MPYIGQTRDLTTQYLSFGREENDFRPVGGATYNPGYVCQLVPLDQWVYPDACTVQLTPAAALGTNIMGVVSDDFFGFNPQTTPPSFVAPTYSNYTTLRGTVGVRLVTAGFHPGVWIDQSGSGAVTVTNGVLLTTSANTAGFAQGYATALAKGGEEVGYAVLPAAGIGHTFTAASLAQASQYSTVATPAIGDVLNLTIQVPYTTVNPGVVQTYTWSFTVNSTTASTVATNFANYLNSQPNYTQFFIASTSTAEVITTVNANSPNFLVTYGVGTTLTSQMTISLSGMIANSLTYASTVTGSGGTSFTANGANLASGTGYYGKVPAFITGGV
jgi:hypothetical protein